MPEESDVLEATRLQLVADQLDGELQFDVLPYQLVKIEYLHTNLDRYSLDHNLDVLVDGVFVAPSQILFGKVDAKRSDYVC